MRGLMITLAFAALITANGCQQPTARASGSTAPLHVALAITPPATDAATGSTFLDVDAERLAAALQAELGGAGFTTVSVLGQPFDPHDPISVDRGLQRAAELGADAVLTTRLDYFADPILSYSPGVAAANLVALLFAVPALLIWDDNDYQTRATMQTALYDVSGADLDAVSGRPPPSPLWQREVHEEFVSLDLTERASGAGHYALALIVPATFIANDTAEAAASLEQKMVDGLARQLALAVQSDAERLRTEPLHGFGLANTPRSDVRRISQDEVEVNCWLRLAVSRSFDRLAPDGFDVWVDGHPREEVTWDVANTGSADGPLQVARARLPIGPRATVLRVRVRAPEPSNASRSWTFTIPAWEGFGAAPRPAAGALSAVPSHRAPSGL